VRAKTLVVAASCLSLALAAGARAADWPTYNHDAARSAVTDESLRLPLKTAWTHASPHPPAAAWPDPARHDYWHNKHHLNPRVIYDRAFHVAIAGDAVFFGSSADDRVVCLGLADGKVRWTFITEGPVRLAPTVADGKVYVGSDDGWVYCLSASDGHLLWKARPGPDDRRCIGNGRMISRWPVRTGVIVDDGFAYCAAGLLPTTEGVYLCALDAASGRQHWKQKVNQPAQGYLLASSDRLYLPTGRTGPGAFDRKDGRGQGGVASAGGGYALVAGDVVAAGPGDTAGQLDLSDAKTRHRIVSFGGLHLIARESRYYVHSRTHLAALDRAKYMPLARRRVAIQTQLKKLGKRKDAEAEAERARLTKEIDGCTAAMKTCWLWRAPCAEPYALILAGNTLFAGGDGRVVAYRADDGQQVWSGNVNGRAYGLAASGGRLLVSTNQGTITCFGHGVGATDTSAEPEATLATRPPLPVHLEPGTLGCWIFRPDCIRDATVRDLAGKADATLRGPVAAEQHDGVDALLLGGTNSIAVTEDLASPALPRQDFTAEAWVRIDRPIEWGGIVGVLQDNGNYEKGWLLGYRNNRFSFAVAGAASNRLTYLTASSTFEPGRWYHVAGTYDGTVMMIYVNGKAAGSSRDQSGPIAYPPKAFYDIGAYHDDNEFYRMTGAVHEVRVWNKVLTPQMVRRRWSKKAARFPVTLFAELPQARVSDDGTAVIEWESALDTPAVVEYGTSRGKLTGKAEATAQAGRFRTTIQGLAPNRIYRYRVVFDDAQPGRRRTSDVFSFRTPTDPFALPSPYPKDKWTPLYERAAAAALRQCGVSKGFCLVLDAGTGRLAYEIAKRSDLRIVGIEGDAAKVAAARRALSRVGAYGKRIAIHHAAGHGDRLPYPPYFANLIVSDAAVVGGALPPSQEEILRVLRPYGGVVCIGCPEGDAPVRPWLAVSRWQGAEARIVEENGLWAVVRRGRLPGAGEWTHGLADLGNTACSQDERIAGPLQVQWFGRPGPREMADRHHRNVSPLVKDGRLFVPGDEQVIAVDAYNGTELWTRRIPNSRRLGVFLDSSNMAVDDTALYFVAQDTCHQFEVATGKTLREIVMPQLVRGETRHWGYLAPADGLLVGSGRRPHAAYFRQSREADAALWNDRMALVTSDYLFALGPAGGRPRWTYKSGLILNTTLAIGVGRVYFIESHSPKALANKVGRMPMVTFLDGPNYLVALDLKTGRTLWKQEADLANCRHIAYINYAAEKLVLSGNKYIDGRLWYFFWGIEADSGTIAWHRSHNSGYKPGGTHGEQNRHPTIVGNTVYAYPLAYTLHSGEPIEGWKFSRHGHGCGNLSASAYNLFWRGGNPWRWGLRPGGQASKVNSVSRPGCWINIIPAGGMLLIPEASSGCTCAYPLQTSIGYVPAP